MFGIPIRNPTNLIINIAATTTTIPIMPVIIFLRALSSACLSPPAVIIPIAPIKKTKTNQIMAIIVIRPTVDEMNLENIPTEPEASLFSRPSVPNPLKVPKFTSAVR